MMNMIDPNECQKTEAQSFFLVFSSTKMNSLWQSLPFDLQQYIVSFLLGRHCLLPSIYVENDMDDPWSYEFVNDVYNVVVKLSLVRKVICHMVRMEKFSFYRQTLWRKEVVDDLQTDFWLEGFPLDKLVLDYTDLWYR